MTTPPLEEPAWPDEVKAGIFALNELLLWGKHIKQCLTSARKTARFLQAELPPACVGHDFTLPHSIGSWGDLWQHQQARREHLGKLSGPWHQYFDDLDSLEYSVRRWRAALAECRRCLPLVARWTDDRREPLIKQWTTKAMGELNTIGGMLHPLEVGDRPLDLQIDEFAAAEVGLASRIRTLKSISSHAALEATGTLLVDELPGAAPAARIPQLDSESARPPGQPETTSTHAEPLAANTAQTPTELVGYTKRRDELFVRARACVSADPAEFKAAGDKLADLFTAEVARGHVGIGMGASNELYSRASTFANALKSGLAEDHGGWFDFDGNQPKQDRQACARVFMLAFLLVGDPDATEVITEEISIFGGLTWNGTGGLLGLGLATDWTERGSWKDSSSPSPRQLDRLERAVGIIESAAAPENASSHALLKPAPERELQKPNPQPQIMGYTATDLRTRLSEAGFEVSETTFARIRRNAQVAPSPAGGAGPHRKFSDAEIRKLAASAAANSRNGTRISAIWLGLLEE